MPSSDASEGSYNRELWIKKMAGVGEENQKPKAKAKTKTKAVAVS